MHKAVVLLNMGGPNSLYEVEMFLKNMFNDPRILPIKNPFIRSLVATFITARRSEKSKQNYRQIGGKSPLVEKTFNLIEKLQKKDSSRFYTYAMRYTPPLTEMAIQELIEKEIKEVLLFSLYPQYSTTTTLSSIEEFYKQCARLNYRPKITEIDRYFDHPLYHEAILEQILKTLDGRESSDYTLIFSSHSLPQKVIDAGDPYQQEILQSVARLKNLFEDRQIHFKQILISYQSKIGPIKWLGPLLEEVLQTQKEEKILIYPLSFTMENSETAYDLNIAARKEAEALGIPHFEVIPCLNDSDAFVHAILEMIFESEKSEKNLN